MRYVAAYLLAVLGGQANPTDKDIKKILSSVGIDADDACLQKVISELKGKNVTTVMEAGKLTSLRCVLCLRGGTSWLTSSTAHLLILNALAEVNTVEPVLRDHPFCPEQKQSLKTGGLS